MSQDRRKDAGGLPRGEKLRRALRWLSDEGRHDAAAIEKACRRFDLSPADEEFLLREARRGTEGRTASTSLRPTRPAGHRLLRGRHGETVCRPARNDEFLSSENVHILESWNTDADPGLSIARARLAPGEATEPHRLDGTAERYLIVKGKGSVKLGSLPITGVEPGDVVFIPPGVSQQIANSGDDDLVFYCLCTPAFDVGDYRRLDPRKTDRDRD